MEDINNTIKYVIYCRKSTDESSGKQVQSIPDQIKACIKYAENNGLNIMRKPKDFSDFETEQDIIKEDNEIDINNRRTYQETRNLFIIKEQESAKTPGIRKKRKKLISLIKQGKINGLLSYSPDRQARNMLEGGELITLVDDTSLGVELKYTNFYFENTASGKMMLGIWFVFSKQYSDKLSEDTSRGMQSKMEAGKALGNYKHGYYFLPSGHHQVHPKFFELWKEAFHMKIYNNKSDEFIRNRLTKKGYIKETYNEEGKIIKTQPVKLKNMHIIRTDPFYYGLFIRGESQIDLREINPDYQPLISQEEHQILIEKYYENKGIKFTKETKEENKKIMPLPEGFVKTEDGYNFTFCLPNKKRLLKKLNKETERKRKKGYIRIGSIGKYNAEFRQ